MSWIPVYGYAGLYECNPETGQVRKCSNQRISNRLREDTPIVSLSKNNFEVTKQVSHVIYESCLNQSVHGATIGHKDGNTRNNAFNNLYLQHRSRGESRRITVVEYKNGLYHKTYPSITDFTQHTGISYQTLKRNGDTYHVGMYRWKLEKNPKKFIETTLLLEVDTI